MKWIILVAAIATARTCAAGLAVMSVDFGSEFMKIAIVKPGVPMEIALNKESRRKTPVVVAIKDGARLFSDPAMNVALKYPKYAYRDLLDLLGKKYSNPIVKEYEAKYPYYSMEADPDNGLVVFKQDDGSKYTVEELIAMILESSKVIASDYAGQPITETVITVPLYFNQAERRAMLRAGDMAGLKVLQLLNDNTAVALNYGVFRRKEFNVTAVNYMFIDMGSSKTTTTLVSYQVIKAKNPVTGVEETFPQLTIKGVGFDRTLGGKIFQSRLADHLAKEFTKMKKTSSNVYDSPRALQKLHKEAGRLKQVLSANAAHFAQIEGLLDDEDFRVKVSRDQFEEMCSDLFDRVDNVISDAMKSTELTLDEISEVILMGAGTRVPKVQDIILKYVNREELAKSINTDEAAALGASYQAAHLSKGYKVKKFGIKDANIFPIQIDFAPSWDVNGLPQDQKDLLVEFERVRTADDGSEVSKTVKRTLFGRMNPFPQKKVMTFNKHTKDFGFVVNYGDLSFMDEKFLEGFGKLTLQEVALIGIEDAHNKHSKDGEPKGTKAHFRMDDSGILVVDKVESIFEKLVPDEEVKEESTFSKIGSTISSFFGGGTGENKNDDKEGSVDETKDEQIDQRETKENDVKESKAENATEHKTGKDPETTSANESNVKEPDAKDTDAKDTDAKDTDAKDTDAKESDSKESEKDEQYEKQESEESSSGKEKVSEPAKEKEDETKVDTEKPVDSEKDEKNKENEKDEKVKSDDNVKDGEKEGEKKEEEKIEVKTKPVPVREEIKNDVLLIDVADPSADQIKASKKKLLDLRNKDVERIKLAQAQNDLESFIIDTQDKLYQELYEKCSTEEEREEIRTKLSEASDWLYEQDENAERKVYEDKLKELKKLTTDIYQRVYEATERPVAMETLNSMVNYTKFFLTGMRNLTGEDEPFTDIELTTMEKLISSTEEWNTTMQEEQLKTAMHKKPKLLVEDIARKIGELDREVKYLMNKLKTFRPKMKPKAGNKTEEAGKSNSTSKKNTKKTTDSDDHIETPPSDDKAETTSDTPADEEQLELPVQDTDDKATDEKATHEKATDDKETDEKATDDKKTDEKATDNTEKTSHKKSPHDPDDEL